MCIEDDMDPKRHIHTTFKKNKTKNLQNCEKKEKIWCGVRPSPSIYKYNNNNNNERAKKDIQPHIQAKG